MSVRKWLIQLNNRFERNWQSVDLAAQPVTIAAGWYIVEFLLDSSAVQVARLVVRDSEGEDHERLLHDATAGRNRSLIYLHAGELVAYSKSVAINRLEKLNTLEARARILLSCARYLWDWGPKVLFRIMVLQFLEPAEISDRLLKLYAPDQKRSYLYNMQWWKKFKRHPRLLNYLAGPAKIAVLIEEESQREDLESLLVSPDLILSPNQQVPESIDFVLPLRKSERLRSASTFLVKRALKKARQDKKLVYTDHDYIEVDGEPIQLPVFKPKPSRAYLHCFNYIGFAVLFSRDVVPAHQAEGGNLSDLFTSEATYRIALECFEKPEQVLHISEAIFQSSATTAEPTPTPRGEQSPWRGIEWHRRDGFNALVASESHETDLPTVDLIVPTRDGLAVLEPCINSILQKTTYPNYRIIIVDNGSENAETFEFFKLVQQHANVDVVEYPGEFNYSAINNFAAAKGCSDYIGLINNDIEVISGDWLTQMMAWAVQPSVGIVGAKLLFSDGRVQHAGVTIGMGNAAGHIHRLENGDAPGYQHRCLATQNMMAVTAACLITPRSVFEKMGGLDEQRFKVAYNDIDYCLKVEASGLEVIWTPEATLFHHESVSRGDDMSDQHVARYFKELKALQSRWKTKGFVDKYYSPHLRIGDEGVFPKVERNALDQLVWLSGENSSPAEKVNMN